MNINGDEKLRGSSGLHIITDNNYVYVQVSDYVGHCVV